MKPLTKSQIKAKAIRTYNEIKSGKVQGIRIATKKAIKMGSITMIID